MADVVLSIVVPVYNAWPYLAECAESLFSQDFPESDFEVLFVDDGSTDDSAAYLDGLARAHPNARVFHRPGSGTPAAPRNFGIEQARGTYLFFVDADDYLYPHAVRNMVAHAQESGCDLGLFKIDRQEWGSDYSGLFDRSYRGCTIEDAPLLRFLGCYKLYRLDLLRENGIRFPLGAWAEDQPFALECYFAARNICVFNDRDYYHYRRRADGLSATLGGLSADFDSADAAFAGCEAYFRAADRHTSVARRPDVYERGLENVCDVLVRFARAGAMGAGERERYRALLAPYRCDGLRAQLSFSRLVAFDALMLGHDDRTVLLAAGLHESDARIERVAGGYRLVDGAGRALFEASFPPEELLCPALRAPQFARAYLTDARAAGAHLALSGRALLLSSRRVCGDDVRLRVRDRASKAACEFSCDASFDQDGPLYATVGLFDFAWEATVDLAAAAALAGDAAQPVLDVGLALFADGEELREVRVAAARGEDADAVAARAQCRLGTVFFAPVTTDRGNFSLRPFDVRVLLENASCPPVNEVRWEGARLVLSGRSRWPIGALSSATLCAVSARTGEAAGFAELRCAPCAAPSAPLQTWCVRLDAQALSRARRGDDVFGLELRLALGDEVRAVPLRLSARCARAFARGGFEDGRARLRPRMGADGGGPELVKVDKGIVFKVRRRLSKLFR